MAKPLVKFGRSFRRSGATLRRAEHLLRRLSNAFVSSAGRWSRFDVRGSRSVRGSVARAPHYRRAERLLRRRSGDMARLPNGTFYNRSAKQTLISTHAEMAGVGDDSEANIVEDSNDIEETESA